MRKLTTDEFISKAKEVHGDLYDYSQSEYIKSNTKLKIIDPRTGNAFWQRPNDHLSGKGNPEFRVEKIVKKTKSNLSSFIEKAKEVHGDLYDYSKAEYVNCKTPLCIVDPDYGEFFQTPNDHLRGKGNQQRGKNKSAISRRLTTEQFITNAKIKHKDSNYDYSETVYVKSEIPVRIYDKVLKMFFYQLPHNHLNGQHNPRRNTSVFDTESFIKKSNEVHNFLYDYSKVQYVNNTTSVCIIDPIHGEFWQIPSVHLLGSGCPKCAIGDAKCIVTDIDPILCDDFYMEKRFEDCRDKKPLPFDRFVPYLNMLLEYDGEQHFFFKKLWHKTKQEFEKSQKRDKIKSDYAINNGYNFIRIAYYEDHIQAVESFLSLVLKHQDKQIVQIYGEVQILDKN